MVKAIHRAAGRFPLEERQPIHGPRVADGPLSARWTTPDGYPAAILALAAVCTGWTLPAKYVLDSDGIGHETTAARFGGS
jgi:hypothetical protein